MSSQYKKKDFVLFRYNSELTEHAYTHTHKYTHAYTKKETFFFLLLFFFYHK